MHLPTVKFLIFNLNRLSAYDRPIRSSPLHQKSIAADMDKNLNHHENDSDLAIEPISLKNVEEAINLTRLCFPLLRDQKMAALDFYAFARGKMSGQDPLKRKPCTIVGYQIFRNKNAAIGTSGLYYYLDRPTSLWLSWVCVHPERRNQGIGTVIIDHAIRTGKKLNFDSVSCVTNDENENKNVHRFYETSGFVRVDMIHFRDEKLRVYEKKLQIT